MKLINKEFNASYESPTLEWDEDWGCYIDHTPTFYEFHKEDGWEELKDEDWHDLRKNPNDLPSGYYDVYIAVDMEICCGIVRIYKLGFYHKDARLWVETEFGNILHEKVIAWREKPIYKEED